MQTFIEGTHLNQNASQRLGELNNIGRKVSRLNLPGNDQRSPTVQTGLWTQGPQRELGQKCRMRLELWALQSIRNSGCSHFKSI